MKISPKPAGSFITYSPGSFTTHPYTYHEYATGAPDEWSRNQGATHTLIIPKFGYGDTRPAKILKTVAYIGIDENADCKIVWEKWKIKRHYIFSI